MRAGAALAAFFISLCPPAFVHCQERVETAQFGIYAQGGWNLHTANFQTLPDVPSCCPQYGNGSGLGWGFGGFYDLLSASPLSLELRLGYSTLNATLKRDEFTTVQDLNGSAVPGEFEYSVQAALGMLSLSPMVTLALSSHATILAGPTLGWIPSNSITEKESLIEPSNFGTFNNGLRTRNVFSGPRSDASKWYLGATAGLQYRVPLNSSNTLFALPGIFGTYGATAIISGLDWRASSVSGGVAIEYRVFEPIPPPPPPPPPPPLATKPPAPEKPKPPALSASLAVATVDSAGNQIPIKEVVIEDYIRTQYRPLLNYLFFDSGSARIPSRYHLISRSEAPSYDFKKFNSYETLPLYYEILNIVGSRMQEYPRANLTIVGCAGDPADPRSLGSERANAVFQYLRDVWAIAPSRLRTETRGLPEKPSNPSDTDGMEENRRAEIYSNVPQILEPIFTTDTAHVPKPPVVRLIPGDVSAAGLGAWRIERKEGTTVLGAYMGNGTLPANRDWDLNKESESFLEALDTIRAILALDDVDGQHASSNPVTVPVRHFTLLDKHRIGSTDTIVSRYSLILFNFDRSDLGEENRRIADFVKARISATSKVRILGYTDRMGTDEYNQKLSDERARATEQYIGVQSADVRGLGRSALLYDNNLPEGRFYSRTVTVVVTTPTVR